MKNSFFTPVLFFLLLLAMGRTFAQTNGLNAKIHTYVETFDRSGNSTGYVFTVTNQEGQIRPGQAIDAVSGEGTRHSFKVVSIKKDGVAVTSLPVGSSRAEITVKGVDAAHADIMNQADEGFSFVGPGGALPGSTAVAATPAPATAPANPELHCTKNGLPWAGASFGNSNLYYTKGIATMYEGKPYLILAFQANSTNQLTFTFKGLTPAQAKVGVVDPKLVECMFSGDESGESVVMINRTKGLGNTPLVPFRFEVTSWRVISADEVEISAKFSGSVFPMFSTQATKIEGGEIKNAKVRVFTERY
jgi:hypothetical protein